MAAAFAAFAGIQAPAEADAMLAQLSKIRLDKKRIYSVRKGILSTLASLNHPKFETCKHTQSSFIRN